MNAEHINPFISGSQRVLESICGERPKLGKVFIKKSPHNPHDVGLVVNIVGDLPCITVYTMNLQTAYFLASKMMMGMPVEAIDFMSQSALSELSNMITGHVATAFSEKEISLDITPPEFIENAFPNLSTDVVCIPLTLSGGIFEINVCFP